MNYWAKNRLIGDINLSIKYYQGQMQEISMLLKSNQLNPDAADYFRKLNTEYETAIEQLKKHSDEVGKL